MNNRNTRQRQLIIEVLMKDTSHPTIAELYQKVLIQDPKIGQATVYRNVSKLVKEGKIKRISTTKAEDHYDGGQKDHYHLLCKNCGKLVDIFDLNLTSFLKQQEQIQHIQMDEYSLLLKGLCRECKNLKKQKTNS